MRSHLRAIWRIAEAVAVVYLGVRGGDILYDYISADWGKPPVPPLDTNFGSQKPDLARLFYAKENGRKILYIPEGPFSRFYLSWKVLGRDNAFLFSDTALFQSWQDQEQKRYLEKMLALIKEMPEDCRKELELCPEGIPFVKKANDLNQQYNISTALRLWQAQRMERAYIAALMDKGIREAVRDWKNLSREQKLAVGKKLISYQFSGYDDVTSGHRLPALSVEKGLVIAGAAATAYSPSNEIHIDENSLDNNTMLDMFSIFWHEGRHIISGILRDMLATENGRAYFEKHGLLTEIKIDDANYYYFYSEFGRKDTTYDDSQLQAEEAASVNDGIYGQMLGKRLLQIETSSDVTIQQARDYFYADHPFTTITESASLHALFLQQWEAGTKICYDVEIEKITNGQKINYYPEKCDIPPGKHSPVSKPLKPQRKRQPRESLYASPGR